MTRGTGPPHVVVEVFAPWDHALVGSGNYSCERGACRARRRLLVRGGDLSEGVGVPLVGNWSVMLRTGREQEVLPVMVLTGVLSPSRLESWPSRCQS
jgi:hypothetical protein